MSAEAWPSDEHLYPPGEDLAHEPTPACQCKPQFIGRTKDGKRLYRHWEVAGLLH
jgi:hypothetical protein